MTADLVLGCADAGCMEMICIDITLYLVKAMARYQYGMIRCILSFMSVYASAELRQRLGFVIYGRI